MEYKDLELPIYRNTKLTFADLTVSDLVKAAVIAPLNILLVGDTGTGKTQLAKDIYNHYFKGNKKEGGHGVFIRGHPDLDIYNEIFSELNLEKAQRELTKNIEAVIYLADELNRTPPIGQNQFFGLGDGNMDYKGRSLKLGKDNYHLLLATANLGNGEFQGTFETDKALYNRLHITIDFDYEMFKPMKEDEMILDEIKADPNVKEVEKRDILDKIVEASKEIEESSKDPGLEALAVVNYLRFGLDNCQKKGNKEKVWPLNCQECEDNKKGEALCSLVRAPVRRTQNAMIKYAVALQYLAKLKTPEIKIDAVDLMFKAFELTGAYQLLLNPQVLRQEHYEQNPKMMAGIVGKLKEDFKQNEDYIMTSLNEVKKGKKIINFFKDGKGRLGNYDKLNLESKKKFKLIEPYTDQREIGLGWVTDFIDFQIKNKG